MDVLIAAISKGELDDELTILHDTIAQRLSTLRAIRSANALLHFKPGDRVQLNCNTRPLYLHGAYGTVTGLIDQQVIIKLDQPIGRYRSEQLHYPPLTLNKIDTEGT